MGDVGHCSFRERSAGMPDPPRSPKTGQMWAKFDRADSSQILGEKRQRRNVFDRDRLKLGWKPPSLVEWNRTSLGRVRMNCALREVASPFDAARPNVEAPRRPGRIQPVLFDPRRTSNARVQNMKASIKMGKYVYGRAAIGLGPRRSKPARPAPAPSTAPPNRAPATTG